MTELVEQRNWKLSSPAFHELLRWLDVGADSKGETFLEMRRRLVAYFDRKNCSTPEELADETLNRVARRLEDTTGLETETPAKYCYTVARFVFLEYLRAQRGERQLRRDLRYTTANADDRESKDTRERMLDCLEKCLGKLSSPHRELILRYYFGQGAVKIATRQALAAELHIATNALALRACRLRQALEACVRECARERHVLGEIVS